MKRYLKLTRLLIASLLSTVLLTSNAIAQNMQLAEEKISIKQQYYESVVSSWGFKVIPKENKTDINDELQFLDQYTVKTKENYVFEFFKETNPLTNYQVKEFGFRSINTNQDIQYYVSKEFEKTSIAIDLNYLVPTETYNSINTYFNAFHKSLTPTKKEEKGIPEISKLNPVILETFTYALVLIIFALISYKTALLINKHKKKSINVIKIESKSIIENIVIWADKISPYAYLLLIFLFGILMYLVVLASYVNKGEIDYEYILDKVNNLTKIGLDINILKSKNLLHIGILFLARAIQITLSIVLIHRLIDFAQKIINIENKQKINEHFVRHLIILCLIVITSCVMLTNLKTEYVIPLTVSIVLIWNIKHIFKSKVLEYTNKEKTIYLLALAVIVIIAITTKVYQYNNPKTTQNDLFASDSKLIFLPYQKEIDGDYPIFIQKKIIKADFPIYANGFMIYSPKYENLDHVDIKSFESLDPKTSNIAIVYPEKIEKMYEMFIKSAKLRNIFESQSKTNLVYLKNEEIDFLSRYSAVVEINCSEDIQPTNLFIRYTETDDKKETKIKSSQFAKFSGCNKDDDPQLMNVSLPEDLYENEYIISLEGIDRKYISSFEILVDGQRPSSERYIEYTNSDKTKYVENSNEQKIYILNIDKKTEITLKSPVNTEEKGIDLSENINTLVKKGLLKNSFVVWSTEPNALIYNRLEN